jgi:hypothetical protein
MDNAGVQLSTQITLEGSLTACRPFGSPVHHGSSLASKDRSKYCVVLTVTRGKEYINFCGRVWQPAGSLAAASVGAAAAVMSSAAGGRVTASAGSNLLGQHTHDRNQDATVYVGNLDDQVGGTRIACAHTSWRTGRELWACLVS